MYKIKYLWNISINPIQTWLLFLHATGREASEAPSIPSRPLTLQPPRLYTITYSSSLTFGLNLIDRMTLSDVIMTSYFPVSSIQIFFKVDIKRKILITINGKVSNKNKEVGYHINEIKMSLWRHLFGSMHCLGSAIFSYLNVFHFTPMYLGTLTENLIWV